MLAGVLAAPAADRLQLTGDSALGGVSLLSGAIPIGQTNGTISGKVVSGDGTIGVDGVLSLSGVELTDLVAVAPGYVLVGNASSQAVAVAVSGDVSINTNGVVSIATNVIVDADIGGAAAIAETKLALVGVTTKVSLAGVLTEIDPAKVDLDRLLDEIQYALSLLEPDTETDPANSRPGITAVQFN
jgi:hypothetical protein